MMDQVELTNVLTFIVLLIILFHNYVQIEYTGCVYLRKKKQATTK